MKGSIRGLLAFAAVLGAVLAWTGTASAAPVADPERNSTALTGWYWYHNATPAGLSGEVTSTGARIIDLEIEQTSPDIRFSAALVANSGTYARGWYWFYDLTAADVATKISTLGARIIDLERYVVGVEQRFAIVMVVNTGVAAKSWWWYYNTTASVISSQLSAHGARLIDLDSYTVGGVTRYSAVMIRNSGVDAKAWWWYLNVTPTFVSQRLAANHARLIDVERRSSGRLDVVMQRRGSEYWWWYINLTSAGVSRVASQNGARIADIETYLVGSARRFAVVLLNDLNAESSRLREIMRPGGGSFGVYLKKVGGGTYVGLQQNTIFEPASSIKVLYHLLAMRSVMNTPETLSSSFDYWRSPTQPTNKDVCPDPTWESNAANKVTTTLQDGLTKMMQVSDNRTTRGMDLRYGRAAVNGLADGVGMSNTEIRQILGCGFNNGLRNDFTLVDAGKLYEGVSNGTQLSGADRTSFWTIMSGGAVASNSALATIVREEATKLGKSLALANTFRQNMNFRSKGGSYDICNSNCSAYTYIRTGAGRMTLPFKSGGTIVSTDYVYGRFLDALFINCAPKGSNETVAQAESRCLAYKKANAAITKAGDEVFRSQIRAALQTW